MYRQAWFVILSVTPTITSAESCKGLMGAAINFISEESASTFHSQLAEDREQFGASVCHKIEIKLIDSLTSSKN